jgi:adenosylcobinamide kinase/adenosylcobinamide-phosphate guanylyltransferase
MHELILGGQRSGKSRVAEARAACWLRSDGHQAVLIATALAGDAEMAERIQQHRTERSLRVPGLQTHEEPHALATALTRWSATHRLLVIDCLTLWLTQLAMPLEGPPATRIQLDDAVAVLMQALQAAPGPVVLVSNEIGSGLAALSGPVRQFVDALGSLHQTVARCCSQVTLMVAGCELPVKRQAAERAHPK